MILLRKGLILLSIILVMTLYWVLQRPIGLKFFGGINTFGDEAKLCYIHLSIHFMCIKGVYTVAYNGSIECVLITTVHQRI